jgi:integrase/recombinase XerD
MLSHALECYLALRRAAGFELRVPAYLLRSFVRFAQDRDEQHVNANTALDWAALAPSPAQRCYRLNTVIRFARHLQAEDPRHQVPPPHSFGHHRQRPVPFIFTPAQIAQLIQGASQLGPPDSLRPYTYSTLFALLAATGIRISEALALRYDDITDDGLLIQRTKFKKSRLVPLHETAVTGLQRYLARRRRVPAEDDHLFISLRGQALRYDTVHETFCKLVDTIGLRAAPGQRRPRLHSLRHTFAVRALETCPEARDHVGARMVALSTYLGHAQIAGTFWYLEATPPLLADIANSTERFMQGGTP